MRRIFVTLLFQLKYLQMVVQSILQKLLKIFVKRWGIHHCISSAHCSMSNGKAELAVKRLLMENVCPNGELENDKIVQALFTQRNTPDPGCKIHPEQIH